MDRAGTETSKAIATIQASRSSTRPTGKALKQLTGKPEDRHIAKRAEAWAWGLVVVAKVT